jgi:hypothetical protein
MNSTAENSWRRAAWIFILIVEAGFIAWGAMAALALNHLLGPRGLPILPAGYEGYTGGSWEQLELAYPQTAAFTEVLFRLYGAYNVAFGVLGLAITLTAFRRGEAWAWWALLVGNTITLGAAMTYDRLANAIGPFEILEYVGLLGLVAALTVTAPYRRSRSRPPTSDSVL